MYGKFNPMKLGKISCACILTLAICGCANARKGILVMAHGGDEAWNQSVEEAVQPLRDKYPIEIAYGMARTSTLREGVRRLEERGVREIAVVRMFISGESFLEETEYILGLRDQLPGHMQHAHHADHPAHADHGAPSGGGHHGGGHHMEPPEPIETNARLVLSREGVSESPLVEEILTQRIASLSSDPARESVLILAHGPGDDGENERWLTQMRQRAERIQRAGSYRQIHCETLREDWPEKRVEAEKRIRRFVAEGNGEDGRVIVVPFRVAGFGPYRDVLEGLEYVSDGKGFCPHPNMTRWIEETAHRCWSHHGDALASERQPGFESSTRDGVQLSAHGIRMEPQCCTPRHH